MRNCLCWEKLLSLRRESKRSSETSYACERGLSHELKNRLDCHAIARNDVKIARHPELDSGAINADFEPLSCLSGTLSPSGEGKCGCAGEMKENTFTDKVYSLFTTHHSLIHNDMVFSRFTSHFSLKAPAFDTDFTSNPLASLSLHR